MPILTTVVPLDWAPADGTPAVTTARIITATRKLAAPDTFFIGLPPLVHHAGLTDRPTLLEFVTTSRISCTIASHGAGRHAGRATSFGGSFGLHGRWFRHALGCRRAFGFRSTSGFRRTFRFRRALGLGSEIRRDDSGIVHELGGRTFGDLDAEVHHRDAVTRAEHHGHVVLDLQWQTPGPDGQI